MRLKKWLIKVFASKILVPCSNVCDCYSFIAKFLWKIGHFKKAFLYTCLAIPPSSFPLPLCWDSVRSHPLWCFPRPTLPQDTSDWRQNMNFRNILGRHLAFTGKYILAHWGLFPSKHKSSSYFIFIFFGEFWKCLLAQRENELNLLSVNILKGSFKITTDWPLY